MHRAYYFLIALAAYVTIELLIVVFLGWSAIKGAPWAPTRKEKINKMFSMAKITPNDLVYDLGCGDGRILIATAKNYNARAIGIEIDPFRYLLCKLRIRIMGLNKKVEVIRGDFYKTNLKDADIVICYLLQSTNYKLQEKFLDELQPNAIIISNKFTFPDLNLISKDDELKIYAYNTKINE